MASDMLKCSWPMIASCAAAVTWYGPSSGMGYEPQEGDPRNAPTAASKIAGVTAHFVSMHLDEGPIIAQSSFAIRPGMDLKQILAAGQKLETPTLIRAIRLYLSQRLDVYWGVVKEI